MQNSTFLHYFFFLSSLFSIFFKTFHFVPFYIHITIYFKNAVRKVVKNLESDQDGSAERNGGNSEIQILFPGRPVTTAAWAGSV